MLVLKLIFKDGHSVLKTFISEIEASIYLAKNKEFIKDYYKI